MRLTLEIGSGHNPDTRSDILVDKYLYTQKEREGRLVIDRPLIIADGEALPFRSGSFDYLIAKHVLEHSAEPEKFLEEMERVAKAGYIETPNPVAEKLFNWPSHRWFVSSENGRLILKRREEGDVRFGNFFHLLASAHLSMRLFLRLHRDMFHTSFEWKGKIPYIINSQEKASRMDFTEQMVSLDKQTEEPIRRLKERIGNEGILPGIMKSSKLLYRRINSLKVKLRHRRYNFEGIFSKILCCPVCKDEGELKKERSAFSCIKCGIRYPVIEGVPVFNDISYLSSEDSARAE